ncbi:MAG TPA: hypothetical protein DIT09_13870 [Glutamicibacter sp.]|nr:hypothetical protein [Glutamicibacter sp.]
MRLFGPYSRPMSARITAGALGALMLSLGVTALPAAQADEISWGINPGGDAERSSFSYELDPGQSLEDSFEITNYGTKPLELSIYGADGLTSANGALELLPASESSIYIGAWIHVDQPSLTLAAGEDAEVGFTLNIPEDVEPGDYVGGMISSYIDSASEYTVTVDQRLATQLAVRVGGEGTTALSVTEASASAPIAWNPFAPVDATVQATVVNEGSLRARGSYTVKISGPFGIAPATHTFLAEELLPGSTVQLEQQVPGFWPLLWQQVEVTMDAEGIDSLPAGSSTATATFWTFPAGWIIILLVVIGAAIILGVRRARSWEYEDEEEERLEPAGSK